MGKHDDLHLMTATDLMPLLKEGRIKSVDLVGACLKRIEEREPDVQAFQFYNAEYAMKQASAIDAARESGQALGPLHGIPVALKDIIDTRDMPTENGLAADVGRRPAEDATIVRKLRMAGAVILGKVTTTEAAYYEPTKTRNPNNLEHTPGGSSSGSAAAVADFMVPLAVGTQTNGSVIRPASFCGIVGFKPGFGEISRHGVFRTSRSLDQIGVFARSVDDAALVTDVLAGADGFDEDAVEKSPPLYLETAQSDAPVRPALGFTPAPGWQDAPEDAREAFQQLCALIGDVDDVPLPLVFEECLKMHGVVMKVEMSRNLARYAEGEAPVSNHLKKIVADGKEILAHDYLAAKDWADVMVRGLEEVFERYDTLITPASIGEAPRDLSQTGDPRAATLWTFCGLPAITLPLLVGHQDMPMGVQLIGPKGEDGRLLRTANWLVKTLNALDA